MNLNASKNKLIILMNLSGSYIGGAQKRYLTLINYLQKNNNDYYFLLNDALYESCINNNILSETKNVIPIPIKYGRPVPYQKNDSSLNRETAYLSNLKQKSKVFNYLGLLSSFLKQLRSWSSYSFKLIKIIKKYDIALIYGVFTGGIWSWLVAKLLNIKFIYSYNDSGASTVEKNILKILSSEYYPLKYADKVDFLSEGLLDKLKEKKITISKNKTLFTPCSFIIYDNFHPEYPKNDWIVFSARLTKIKNPQLLLEAISILKNRDVIDFKLFILGDGVLFPELTKLKDELNMRNVFFEGGVTNTSIHLKKSKIFISIQMDNNYPSQSLLEAMACENAIIASDVGETRKLVTEDEGIIVPLQSEKIADAIQSLIAKPTECERLGKNARKKVLEEHTIEKYSKYFLSITKN
ncbi:MAG: glycosyltransferase [Bacteroidales bacterium]|nr:glycosyltransferase [Bacteroidales bacterium]